MSQQKGGAIVGGGKGRVETGGQGPTRLCYTPHPIHTRATHWYRKPQGLFGGFPPLQHAFADTAEGEKVKLFSNFSPAEHLHLVSQKEPRNPASPRGPSHFSQDAPVLSAFQAGPVRSV